MTCVCVCVGRALGATWAYFGRELGASWARAGRELGVCEGKTFDLIAYDQSPINLFFLIKILLLNKKFG